MLGWPMTTQDSLLIIPVRGFRHIQSTLAPGGGGGRGGTQQIFIRGGSAPRSDPLPVYVPFFTK